MEAGNTPPNTPPRQGEPLSGEEIRRATFPQALRGYDRQAVHDMLDRVADWMEGKAGAISSATPGMREEFARVGEKTAGILTAAEEAARNLRDEAAEYAERLRSDVDEEARKARLNASQRMDEMIAEAEQKAQAIMDDAIARRRQLNVAISSLIDRRDEIAADAARLGEELLAAVEDLRRPDLEDEEASPRHGAGEAEETPLEGESMEESPLEEETGRHERRSQGELVEEPSSQEELVEEPPSEEELVEGPPSHEEPVEGLPIEEEETQVHPGPDHRVPDVVEDDNPEARRRPRLLVDPDEED